jgi:hypothetical protein
MEKQVNLSEDLLDGAEAIAEFTGKPVRRVYYLATKGVLAGVYKEGSRLIGSKAAMREAHERKARGK